MKNNQAQTNTTTGREQRYNQPQSRYIYNHLLNALHNGTVITAHVKSLVAEEARRNPNVFMTKTSNDQEFDQYIHIALID